MLEDDASNQEDRMIGKALQSAKATLGVFLTVVMASAMLLIGTAMLGACASSSSSDEAGDTPGKNCAQQCAGVSEGDQDECIILCEGEA